MDSEKKSTAMAVPDEMRSAVNTSGMDAGSTTCRNTCHRVAPSERTEVTDPEGIWRAASRAVTSIWKNTISVMSATIEVLPIPSSTSSTGRNTALGTG